VVPVSSRLHALRWFAVAAAVPPLVFLVAMPRYAALLLALMWVVLVGTVGLAATSRRPEPPRTWGDRGRLHG
jgi:hypothetical protein